MIATFRKHGVRANVKSLTHYIHTVTNYSPHSSDSEDRAAYKSLKMEMIQKERSLVSRQLQLERDQLELKKLLLSKSLEAEQHKKRLTK